MITKEAIETIIKSKLDADNCFIVETAISADNVIRVVIDSNAGIPIDYCVEISNLIEASLNRDVEDFELEVSSAGIGCELKVLGQFQKNIGNNIEVTFPNGSHIKGILTSANADHFEFDAEEKIKPDGAKKKITVTNHYRYAYSEIKQVKDIISF